MSLVSARRFLEAVSAAVYDEKLERDGVQIYHFFDSDFLGRLIFGYRDLLNLGLIQETKRPIPGNSKRRLLMGALVGQGINAPPLMRALLPHLYEVRRAVEGRRRGEALDDPETAMRELGIEDALGELQQSLDADESPDELLQTFLGAGPQIFYGAELLSGQWKARLGRVLELGISEPSPFDHDPDLVETEAFKVLTHHVGHVKQQGRGGSGVSGLRDAMALATLTHAMPRRSEKIEVRFYTETVRIHRAWRDSQEFRALLTYPGAEEETDRPDYGRHGVLRTVEYYLIRALIPELGYKDAAAADPLQPAAPMFEIADDLTEAAIKLRTRGIREEDLADIQVGASTLGDYMAELAELSPYGTAWRALQGRIPAGLPKTLVRQLKEVLEGEQLKAELDESFQKHVEQLSSRTRDVGEFTNACVRLVQVLSNWTGALRPRFGTYSEHVGLTRWGLFGDEQVEESLHGLVDAYEDWLPDLPMAGGALSTAHAGFVLNLAQNLRAMRSAPLAGPSRLAECVALLGFLWLLEDYKSVIRYGKEFLDGVFFATDGRAKDQDDRWTTYGSVIENMVAVAELAAVVAALRGPPQGDAADALAARAMELVESVGEERRRFPAAPEVRAITQGYIMFRAWLAFNGTVMAHRGTDAPRIRQPALVKESLHVCSAVLETCDTDAPVYPLLLNHCVYVASMARLIDEPIEALARRLMLVRLVEQQVQSYRVDDTLGFYHYVRAATWMCERQADGSLGPQTYASAKDEIRQARDWLEQVPAKVNDSEVRAHRMLLTDLTAELSRQQTPMPLRA